MKPHAFKTWKYFKLYYKKDKIRDGNRYQRAMEKTICDIDAFYEAISANGEMTNDWLLERYAYIQAADKTSANVEEVCLVGTLSGLISGIILMDRRGYGIFLLEFRRRHIRKNESAFDNTHWNCCPGNYDRLLLGDSGMENKERVKP